MKKLTFAVAIMSAALGCGGDDGETDGPLRDCSQVCSTDAATDAPTDAPIDAAPIDAVTIDTPPSSVVVVPCAGATVVSDVTAPNFSFVITDNTIAAGQVVRFMMPGSHSVVSGETAGVPDGEFRVEFNQTVCLQFTAPGTYGFWCNPHQFTGSLTVQ